jgi:hypothetical protein
LEPHGPKHTDIKVLTTEYKFDIICIQGVRQTPPCKPTNKGKNMPIRSGKVYYSKVFGRGSKNYDGDGMEWSFDLAVDENTLAEMEKEGVKSKFKNKSDDRGDFYQFRKDTVKRDGQPAKPIEVVDKRGKPWDTSVIIGNGSLVDVKYLLKEYDFKGKKGIRRNILAIRVKDHVPYEGEEREDFDFDDGWA